MEAQNLAVTVIGALGAILTSSAPAKESFRDNIGYTRFVDTLKSLGQPSQELLRAVLDLVSTNDRASQYAFPQSRPPSSLVL